MTKTIIQYRAVNKHYGNTLAVNHVSFDVREGTVLALLGPSGCGKTTTLRLLAGLERPDSGEVWLNGQCVADGSHWVAPEHRHIGMVFQDYALFPHLTVEANIDFALKGWSRQDRKTRVGEMLELAGLRNEGKRYPHQLSGGQQQRVALVRAMASRPDVLLLDEPFSNLDATLRKTTREEIRQILRAANATAIFVTHDQDEAMSIADLIGVMRYGKLEQIGTPRTLYENPVSADIALFIGEANQLSGEAHGETVSTALGTLPLRNYQQGQVKVLIRPEDITIQVTDQPTAAGVLDSIYYGHHQTVYVQIDNTLDLRVNTDTHQTFEPHTPIEISVKGDVLAYPI